MKIRWGSGRLFAGHAAALAGGLLASFGFAPYAWRSALGVGLILLLCSLHSSTPGRAAVRGGLFGLGYFGCGVYWVYYSIHVYAYTPLWLSCALAALLVAYLSLYPMLAAWLAARLLPCGPLRLIGAATLLAVAEWVRGIAWTGFPWILYGQGSLDSPWAGYLPVAGVYATGLLMLLSAAGVAGWLWRPRSVRVLGLGAAFAIAGAGEALRTIVWGEPVGAETKVALVQPNLSQDRRWRKEHLGEIMRTYLHLTRSVAHVPLVIWPEAAIPQLLRHAQPFYAEVAEALEPETTLMVGAFYMEEGSSRPRTGLVNFKTGQRYGKRHLVPFGEYAPMRTWLMPLYQQMRIKMSDLEASDNRPLLQIRGIPAGAMICYEIVYPRIARLALPEARYVVNVSNDAWFGPTRAPWQHLEAARLRAAESARELLRVASTGVTAILGADGSVVKAAPQFEQTVLEGTVQARRGLTPYVRFGEWLFAVLAALMLAVCLAWKHRGRKR